MKEALKLALEAYLCREMPAGTIIGDPKWWAPKIASAIKEALAQPSQEPVAWAIVGDGKFGLYEIGRETETNLDASSYWTNRGYSRVPLYTTPQQRPWVGLTDEQYDEIWRMDLNNRELMDATIAALKEKNT